MATTTRKTQDRALATQKAILEAALDEFARTGFEGASLRRIGDLAEVNHRLIQHHFGSKLDLWKATATDVIDNFQEHLDRRLHGLDGVSEAEKLRLLFREFVMYSASVPQLNRFMLKANDEPEHMRWMLATLLTPAKHTFMSGLARAQELGVFVAGDPKLLWFVFAGAATSIFAYHEEFEQVTGLSPHNETVLDAHIDTIIRLFFPNHEEGE